MRSWKAEGRTPTRFSRDMLLLSLDCNLYARRKTGFHEGRAFPFLIFCYDSDEVFHVQGLCFMFCELTADMAFKQMVLI